MPLAISIALGILLVLVFLRVLAFAIDWLDARTSYISEEEARRRARLALAGRWPPTPTRWFFIRPVIWTWVFIVIGYLLWTYLRTGQWL